MALTDNLIGYWKLDESSGDAASEVNSYTLTNVNTTTFGTGIINNAGSFNGTNQYFNRDSAGSNFAFGSGTFSISCWIKTSDQSGAIAANGNVGANGNSNWQFTIGKPGDGSPNTGKIGFGTSAALLESDGTYNDNAWHHLVLVREGTGTNQLILYVDGSSVKTSTDNNDHSASTVKFRIGYYETTNTGTDRFFAGLIDEVGIWKGKALTSTEVATLYNSGDGLSYPFSSGVTITPDTLTLSTTEEEPTIKVLVKPLSLSNILTSKSITLIGAVMYPSFTGGFGTSAINTNYPVTDGLIARYNKQTGRAESLIAEKSFLTDRQIVGL